MRVNVAATYNSLGQKYLAYRELLRSERYVRALLGRLTKPGMVLDVGCGAGVPVDDLVVAEGHELIGIDVSKVMIELARRAVPAGSYCVREMRSMRVGEYSASAIICLYSLFHIPRTEHLQMLKIFAGNLEPRGYLLITMGDVEYEGEHEMYGVLSYSSQWSRTKNRMIVELAGYKVISDELERSGGECHQMILARKK